MRLRSHKVVAAAAESVDPKNTISDDLCECMKEQCVQSNTLSTSQHASSSILIVAGSQLLTEAFLCSNWWCISVFWGTLVYSTEQMGAGVQLVRMMGVRGLAP